MLLIDLGFYFYYFDRRFDMLLTIVSLLIIKLNLLVVVRIMVK